MRPEIGMVALMVTNASCLCVPGPFTVFANSGAGAVQAGHEGREAIRKVHDIRRGGSAYQGSTGPAGLFTHVAALPLIEPFPSQVGSCGV